MTFRISILVILTVVFFSACSSTSECKRLGLVEDISAYARHGDKKDSTTAFIMLSNISLTQTDIKMLEDDYEASTDEDKKNFYEFLLAKRTQEEKYILSFIAHSKKKPTILIENNSQWVAIGSPFYELLSYYSRTNDEALGVLIKLVDLADGAVLSIIVDDLSNARRINPERFMRVLKNTAVKEKEILELMEDE